MHNRLKLSHHRHTGRLRPHEYTSYAPLGVLLLIVGLALTIRTVSALIPPPASGSIGLSGTVPGKPPSVAATINTPSNQQHFTSVPITVAGSCPAQTIVEIYKNSIFAGSIACSNTGSYSLNDVDLLIGTNILTAKDYNALNEAGPISNQVTVYYDVASPQAAGITNVNLSGSQLLLNTNAVYRGTFPGQQLNVPVDIAGGNPPYAVNAEWGDATNNVVSRSNNTTFNVSHTYSKPGTYAISLQASDAQKQEAFLTIAAIVNGQAAVSASITPSNAAKNQALVLWPLYASVATAVISFWLGERREKHILNHPKVTFHT